MKEKYSTLSVLYSLVRDSLNPTQFACKPTEIISYHNLAWDTILKHLAELSEEGLIVYTVPSVITITGSGIEKVKELGETESSQEKPAIEKVA